jgi:ATP-dependent Clp protease protease subunit
MVRTSMEPYALRQYRVLLLSEPISAETANRFVADLLLLNAASSTERIDLYINSPGGSVTDGLAILDAMGCVQAPVSTICIGQAASMAAWILASGTKGMRYATPNAEIMIHQLAAGFYGQSAHIRVMSQRVLRLQKRLTTILAACTGQSPRKVARDMERDFFMTADEARRYGIVDAVLEPFSKGPLVGPENPEHH